MRKLAWLLVFAAGLAQADWNDYTEERDLQLDADGLDTFEVDVGAGSLTIEGDPGLREIQVHATIRVPYESEEKAQKIIASDLTLTLDEKQHRARLIAEFDDRGWGFGDSPSVDLEIRMPDRMALVIDDGSGSIHVVNVSADVLIDDGSGSIDIENVQSVNIDDGSGSVTVTGVSGDVVIEDGSGSIEVRHVGGSVTVDDGSGSVTVEDVEHDLIIVDDGSGGVSASNVRGVIEQDD